MTSKLKLYNKALRHIGATRLADLTENRADRRELDAVYDDALEEFLNKGIWYYAIRTVLAEPDTGITVGFGPAYAYPEPEDYVRLHAFCTDEDLTTEDLERRHEAKIFYCNNSQIYLSYVSNGDDYGGNLGSMPELAAEALGCDLALKTSMTIKGDRGDRNDLAVYAERALNKAKVREAVDERPKFRPQGRLVTARGNTGGRVYIRNGRIRF
jgi:hypothetical protein